MTRPLPERASSTEPHAKRQKADGNEDASTILARASANYYTTIEDVLEDVDTAVSDVVQKLELSGSAVHNQHKPSSQVAISLKVSAFRKKAHDLVQKNSASSQQKSKVNGIDSSTLSSAPLYDANSSGTNQILTLYGNTSNTPGNGKQLFSSNQLNREVSGDNDAIAKTLREVGLPAGISTTYIVPMNSLGIAEDKQPGRTLGDLFPSSASPVLQPPKPSKISTTRGSTVGWYQPTVPQPRNGSYFRQAISTGCWLDYSNNSQWQANKRKQRDRAMSLSGSKAPQVDVDTGESEAAKLDGLFRSAYSGFAPTKDDSAAIVPESLMTRIWWDRQGEKSFDRLIENANMLEGALTPDPAAAAGGVVDDADEDTLFQEAIEKWDELTIDPDLEKAVEKSVEEKDADEILESISELLETLNSFARIRNLSLNASTRPVGPISAPDTTSLGTPSKPSESELATYEILKSQLTLMVASLPPFAVAKLDSHQLGELGISTKIVVPIEEYNGVMEEDESKTKSSGLNVSSSTSRVAQPVAIQRPTSTALYGNQYSAPRPAAPVAVSQQYYGSQTPIRQQPNNYQRPPSTAPVSYQTQRPAATAPYRPTASYGTPTYPHQNPRPVSQQYNSSIPQQYHQTPGAQPYVRPSPQAYQSMPQSIPQASVNTRYLSQPSYPQQTPTQNGLGYQYGNNMNTNRQPSPQKQALYSPQPNPTQIQGRPSYATPTAPTSQGSRPYLQNPMAQSPMVNGGSPSVQPQIQQSLGYSTFLSNSEQANLMERQRAQLAQQQGLQQQARSAAQAGVMGTPPKAQVNGGAVAAGL